MLIELWIENTETGEVLEELGTCLTDNPSRAAEMYEQKTAKWAEQDCAPVVKWAEVA